MRVYNTLTRSKEEFVTREPGKVAMYVCGPTVYNHIHIGNARTFLSFDTIRKYLEWKGFEVRFVQNVTDVDDKIIKRANEEGRSAAEVASEYTVAFIEAMHRLGVVDPTVRPLCTETIPQMIDMIQRLIAGGHAYEIDGDVYFSVRSFPGYGKLSGRDIDEMRTGTRIEVDERKADPLDFALWKSAKPGEPHWPSPWGEGRPGWHIECSVMSEAELGVAFDIHGGGADLTFPHHENELAQSEAATGHPFVKYWLHGGMLQVNEEKMSKSLGNFLLLKDVLDRYEASVVRLLMLQTHYRSPLDFSDSRLDETIHAYERLENLVRNLRWARTLTAKGEGAPAEVCSGLKVHVDTARQKFEAEMDDDFNTAGALAAVFELAKAANVFLSEYQVDLCEDDKSAIGEAETTAIELLGVLGIDIPEAVESAYPVEVVELAATLSGYAGDDAEAAIKALLAARAAARTEKNWALADAVRDGLMGLNFTMEDTPQGARVLYNG
ncbi:MAG: cysteine--tRNA ligase [Actinobacteria bacterium HGW-Actinobacteria-7]|jgi:cysteinyl-tRNA synthetase|nr:MAG: cysteine--tRNA ligase [Actinobacteria bacterium HGW-Actinobacteria-7]